MIRPTIPDDTTALIAIARASDLFSPELLAVLGQMLAASLAAGDGEAGFWLTDDDHGPVGMAYCEPERMTLGTWNLQLIMIQRDRQDQGRSTQLLRAVEQAVMTHQGRMLIVETSGLPEFGGRAFYTQAGYEAEGRIRDFYAAGDDKVIFRKVLTPLI